MVSGNLDIPIEAIRRYSNGIQWEGEKFNMYSTLIQYNWHYKIFCVNGKYGIQV